MFYYLAWVLLILLLLLSTKIIKFMAISVEIDSIQLNRDSIQVFICALSFDHWIKSIHCHEQFSLSIHHKNNNTEIFVAFLVVFFIHRQFYTNSQQFTVISQVMEVIFMYFNNYNCLFTVILFMHRKPVNLSKIDPQMQLFVMLHQLNIE